MGPLLFRCMIEAMSTRGSPAVTLTGITKRFPGVVANDEIDLTINRGEIHALLGENGAGKSTLMKILYGVYRPDAGEIHVGGEPATIRSPHDARALRIGMVFQDLSLIPAFTAAENIALFLPDLPFVPKRDELDQRIRDLSESYGLEVDPGALVAELSIGEQQKVELQKLLLSEAQVLILDEPTRVLAAHEIAALFATLRMLCDAGHAVVLITHKMHDVFACADRITVLRAGRVAGAMHRDEASEPRLIQLMFDQEVVPLKLGSKQNDTAPAVLELSKITTSGEGGATALKDISLDVHAGEIVGVAGVSGNGQRELCDLVLGLHKSTAGDKKIGGVRRTNQPVRSVRDSGVGYIPEDALGMATVPYMTIPQNMALTDTRRYARIGGLTMDWSAVRADIQATADRLGINVRQDTIARSLSGGNLQRMVILRELAHEPRLIVASYITRGLDVQTAAAARQALANARNTGAAVLLISEDLDELLELSDRLVVLFDGRIVGEMNPGEMSIEEIGYLMTGGRSAHAQSL